MTSILIFIGAILLFYYPSRIIRSDSSVFGRYHITQFIRQLKTKDLRWYFYSFFFSFITFSSYRGNQTFKTYYINSFIGLKNTVLFLWVRELGKPLFIAMFLGFRYVDTPLFIASVIIFGFFFNQFGSRYYNRALFSIIFTATGVLLLSRSEVQWILSGVVEHMRHTSFIFDNPVWWWSVGLLFGLFLKDALIFTCLSLFFVMGDYSLMPTMAAMICGFLWGEWYASFHEGNNTLKQMKLAISYAIYIIFFTLYFVLLIIYNHNHFFLNFVISLVGSVFTCLLLSFFLLNKIKQMVNYYGYSKKKTLKIKNEMTLADRRIIKAAEMNFMLARRLLRNSGDDCFKMMFNLLRHSHEKGDEFDVIFRENEKYIEKIKDRRIRIEGILQKTAELYISKKTYLEMQAIYEVSNYYSLISRTVVKMVNNFSELKAGESDTSSDPRFYIVDFLNRAMDFLRYINDYIHGRIVSFDMKIAYEMEQEIDNERNKLSDYAMSLYREQSLIKGLSFLSTVKNIEQIGDFILGISKQLNYFYYEK